MKYIALQNFSGVISMSKGDVREIPNDALAKDLMRANLIEKYVPNASKEIKEELETANSTIAELKEVNNKLVEENSKLVEENTELKALLESEDKDSSNGNSDVSTDDAKTTDKDTNTNEPENQDGQEEVKTNKNAKNK